MLEAASHFIGKDGFNWWIGQVENDGSDPKDPDDKNRVKVRIIGYHSPDKKVLPTKDLPWASIVLPATYPAATGAGSVHQLFKNSWVVGFFMDGESAQVPIVMGSIGDQNGEGYFKDGESERSKQGLGYTQEKIVAPGKKPPEERTNKEGSVPGGSKEKDQTDAQKAADKKKCVTVHVGNGKCGSESDVKVQGVLAEFMKFARGIEKNEVDKFIDKNTGKVVDLAKNVENFAGRIQNKLGGLLANIKGVVYQEVQNFINEQLDKIKIPDPELFKPVKDQFKQLGKLIKCLFKQIVDELKNFIKNILLNLLEQALDAVLCLVQDIIGQIMGAVMGLIQQALGILSGVLGAISKAKGLIQGLLNNILQLIDMFCGGDLSCALGLSTFQTCQGADESQQTKAAKAAQQYKKPPGKDIAVTGKDGKLNGKGFVAATKTDENGNAIQGAYNGNTGAFVPRTTEGTPQEKAAADKKYQQETGIDPNKKEQGFWESANSALDKGLDFLTIKDRNGNVPMMALNCSSENFFKKPCFPKLVFDSLEGSTPVKALPIIDNIGSIVGVFMKNRGSDLAVSPKVDALSTCNESEGTGARFFSTVTDGQLNISVENPGIGYGFDPDTTYCVREQVTALISSDKLLGFVEEGDLLFEVKKADGTVSELQPEVLQVVEFNTDGSGLMKIATIDPDYVIEPKTIVRTKDGVEVELNPSNLKLELVIPANATALWAGCPDLIPILESIDIIGVGKNYTNPELVVEDDVVGTVKTSGERLITVTVTKPTIGFVTPEIKDPTGEGAIIAPVYNFVGPKEAKRILERIEYIDCVGHPGLN
jgi:hypothetical protein